MGLVTFFWAGCSVFEVRWLLEISTRCSVKFEPVHRGSKWNALKWNESYSIYDAYTIHLWRSSLFLISKKWWNWIPSFNFEVRAWQLYWSVLQNIHGNESVSTSTFLKERNILRLPSLRLKCIISIISTEARRRFFHSIPNQSDASCG